MTTHKPANTYSSEIKAFNYSIKDLTTELVYASDI